MMRDTRNPSLGGRDGTASKLASAGQAEAAWTQSMPEWSAENTSRLWVAAGAGLSVLACLALGTAALKALLPGNDATCSTGSDCNERGAALAQADDQAPAARLFQRGCDQGHAAACNNLGLAYQSGRGVAEDFEQARTAFQRACNEGFAEGCSNEGVIHEQGLGVPVNLGDAQRLYLQACQHGSALGCSNLGALYAEGQGVEADPGEAARFFAEACSRGSDVGCANLFELQRAAPRPAL